MARGRNKKYLPDVDDDANRLPDENPDFPLTTNTRSTGFLGEDDRLRKAVDDQRRSRAADDPDLTVDRGSGLASTSRERRRAFRDEWTQEALPKLPELPGWHLCWLSTTNQWDPIQRRMRMGYIPVKPEEVPGLQHLTQKSGEWSGMVGVNEMLLFKIHADTYREVMTEFHHDQPLEEENAIRQNAEKISEELLDSDGQRLVELEPDMQALGKRPRRTPVFNP